METCVLFLHGEVVAVTAGSADFSITHYINASGIISIAVLQYGDAPCACYNSRGGQASTCTSLFNRRQCKGAAALTLWSKIFAVIRKEKSHRSFGL